MANIYKLSSMCRVCFGTGVELVGLPDGYGGISQTEQPCTACEQIGIREVMQVDLTDLEAKIDDILDKLEDIKGKLDKK